MVRTRQSVLTFFALLLNTAAMGDEAACFQLLFVSPSGYEQCIKTSVESRKSLLNLIGRDTMRGATLDIMPAAQMLQNPCDAVINSDLRARCEETRRLQSDAQARQIEAVYRETASRVSAATQSPAIGQMPNDASTMLFWLMLANQYPSAQSAIGTGAGTSFPYFQFVYGNNTPAAHSSTSASDAQTALFLQFLSQSF